MDRRPCSVCHTIDGYRSVRERGKNSIDVRFATVYTAKPGFWMAMPPWSAA